MEETSFLPTEKILVSAKIVWSSSIFLLFLRQFNFHPYHLYRHELLDGKLTFLSCWFFLGLTFCLRTKYSAIVFFKNLEWFSFELTKYPNDWTTDSPWIDFNLILAMNFILFIDHFFPLSVKFQLSPSTMLVIHCS